SEASCHRYVPLYKPTVCPSNNSANMLSYQELPTSIKLWRGHGQEAKRGEPGRHRITRNCEALGSLLLPCAITELSLIAMWCPIGATPRGQPWTPAGTLPHGRDGL